MKRAVAATVLGLGLAIGGWAAATDGDWSEAAPLAAGLRQPTDLAVLADGTVLVADPAARAVLHLDASGADLGRWTLADAPTGLGAGPEGVWVALAEARRVVLLDPTSGREIRAVDLSAEDIHPSDVAPGAEGVIWVTSGPDHLVARIPPDGPVQRIPQVGGWPFDAPRGIVPDGAGGAWLTDAGRGLVLHLSAGGEALGQAGGFGVQEGRFLKPKNLALGPEGSVYVVDSHLGALQVLDATGTFQTLAWADDAPLALAHPLGVARVGDEVWVAEAGASRIRRLRPGAAAWQAGPARQLARLLPRADSEPDRICRQCHDGTVTSDPGAWDPGVGNHPCGDTDARLPDCADCHETHPSADREGNAGGVYRFGLPAPDGDTAASAGASCIRCHGPYADASPAGRRRSHPAIARTGDDGADGPCAACHEAHGARWPDLLSRDPAAAASCATCHPDQDTARSPHPVHQVVPGGGTAGLAPQDLVPANLLTCLTCHDPHQGRAPALLREAVSTGRACDGCHAAEATEVQGSGHRSVSCAACHGIHGIAHLPTGGESTADPASQPCVACHTSGRGGARTVRLGASHPVRTGAVGCTSCHGAHGPGEDLLLAGADDGSACIRCHPQQAAVTSTDHDASVVPVGDERTPCLSCHAPHGVAGDYQVAAKPGVNPASGRCTTCHDGTRASDPGRKDHPRGLSRTVDGDPFAWRGASQAFGPGGRVTTDWDRAEITCTTCHDPHRWRAGATAHPGAAEGTEQDSFLREAAPVVAFCEACHGLEGRPLYMTFHSDKFRSAP